MADRDAPTNTITVEDDSNAPFIYFDIVPTHGTFNGAVQVELASRILIPTSDGGVDVKFVMTGHLRCSGTTALYLRDALSAALKMLEQPQSGPAAASKLN